MKKNTKKPMVKKTDKKNAKAAPQRPKPVSTIGVVPLGDRVLVKPLAPETVTSFGIIIPDTVKEKPEQGVVVAVGPGRRGDDNDLVPVGVQVGDTVLFSKYGFDEIKVAGVEYYVLPENSILAVINK